LSWTQTYHYYHLKDTQFSSLLRFTCSASTINLLHWLIFVFLIVLPPKMINYLNKCTELKIYICLVSSLFVYMSKILIDGLLFEILKSQLKLMDEWKNVISQLLKWGEWIWSDEIKHVAFQFFLAHPFSSHLWYIW